ncbi:acyl-CoA dehydrogenase family protein [Streptomyces sp. NPDC048425]|uniref:acyl-CoA dehydrogenase family protein n=1 Tax=Streptomyces sp. NPDC048425 TaxID=3365548 RepID=UPI003718AFF7
MTQALNSSRTAQGTSGADARPDIPGLEKSDPFARLLTEVAARRGEFEEKRHVPRDMIAEFKKAGIYRAGAPARFGGDALPPAEFHRIVERISQVDGSVGWVASFGSSLIYLAALPLDTQAELYADGPDVAFAGGLFPVQRAEPVAGGFRVSGHWKFANGCKGADVLGRSASNSSATQTGWSISSSSAMPSRQPHVRGGRTDRQGRRPHDLGSGRRKRALNGCRGSGTRPPARRCSGLRQPSGNSSARSASRWL